MRAHADRTDAGTAATVRDAERLVQIEVRDVGAELARPRDTDQRVEVRAVEVHLTALFVHDRADIADLLLVHTVRRRVGHHQRGEIVGVLDRLRLQVVDVDVAPVVARDHDHLHARHRRRGGVRAVRGRGDQAHVPTRVAAGDVILPDRQEPGVLTL